MSWRIWAPAFGIILVVLLAIYLSRPGDPIEDVDPGGLSPRASGIQEQPQEMLTTEGHRTSAADVTQTEVGTKQEEGDPDARLRVRRALSIQLDPAAETHWQLAISPFARDLEFSDDTTVKQTVVGQPKSYVEITSLWDSWGDQVEGLQVRIDRDGYRRTTKQVLVAKLDWRSTDGVLVADLTIQQETVDQLRAIVVDEHTLDPVEGATVLLMGGLVGGEGRLPVEDRATTDLRGGFEVGLPQSGSWSLMILHSDYCPLDVDVQRGETLEPLRVRRSRELTVQVLGNGVPQAGLGVALRTTEQGTRMSVDSQKFIRTQAGVMRDALSAVTDEQGFAVLRGLSDGQYVVTVRSGPRRVGMAACLDVANARQRLSLGDEDSLIFDLAVARLEVSATGQATPGDTVRLERRGRLCAQARLGEDRRCSFVVEPLQDYVVSAVSRDCFSDPVLVSSRGGGESVPVVVDCSSTASSLLELRVTSTLELPDEISARLWRPGDQGELLAVESLRLHRKAEGVYSGKASPGRFDVQFTPDRGAQVSRCSVPFTVEGVVIHEGETTIVTHQLTQGGEIVLVSQPGSVAAPGTAVRLIEVDGQGRDLRQVPVTLLAYDGDRATPSNTLLDARRHRLVPCVKEGQYRVELVRGGKAFSNEFVQVVAGQTTQFRID